MRRVGGEPDRYTGHVKKLHPKHRAWSTWASGIATFVFYFKICKKVVAEAIKNIYFHAPTVLHLIPLFLNIACIKKINNTIPLKAN